MLAPVTSKSRRSQSCLGSAGRVVELAGYECPEVDDGPTVVVAWPPRQLLSPCRVWWGCCTTVGLGVGVDAFPGRGAARILLAAQLLRFGS
jgi:hypothetical protein